MLSATCQNRPSSAMIGGRKQKNSLPIKHQHPSRPAMARRSKSRKLAEAIQDLNVQNRTLFEGDNLKYLQAINTNSVDLIVTDPPYNKSKDFYVTLDGYTSLSYQDRWTWKEDVHDRWMENIQEHEPKIYSIIRSAVDSSGEDMGAFLIFMAMRLIEMRRILKPNGSIYLQCDDFADVWLGALMESVFGKDKFRSKIVWHRSRGGHQDSTNEFGHVVDFIYFYGPKIIDINRILIPKDKNYIENNKNGKDSIGYYRHRLPTRKTRKLSSRESNMPWKGYDPATKKVDWTIPKPNSDKAKFLVERTSLSNDYLTEKSILKRLDMLFEAGLIFFNKNGVPYLKEYLEVYMKGTKPTNLWTNIRPIKGNSSESVEFDTQKPLALIERQILASSNLGDVVMDPFAGSCTALIAAEKLGRKWIGMDVGHVSGDLLNLRIAKNPNIAATPEDVTVTSEVPIRNYTKSEKANLGLPVAYFECPTKTLNQERSLSNKIFKEIIKKEKFTEILRRIEKIAGIPGGYGVCPCCGHVLHFKNFDLDHIIPQSKGGKTTRENTQILCHHCNTTKNDRLISLEELQAEIEAKGNGARNDEMFRKFHGLPLAEPMEPLTTEHGSVLVRNIKKLVRFLNTPVQNLWC